MLIPGRGRGGGGRSDEDDRIADAHERCGRLDREQHALQVGADHLVELLLRDLPERSGDYSVGFDHVEAPVSRLDVLERRVHRRGAPGVRPDTRGLGPDLRDGFIDPAPIAARNNDCSAFRYELLGNRQADSSRTTGDNGNLAFK
jgi:hypothetical protein